jgi:hypothetical protein
MLRNQSRGYYSINPAIEETEPNINALTSYRAESWFACKSFYVQQVETTRRVCPQMPRDISEYSSAPKRRMNAMRLECMKTGTVKQPCGAGFAIPAT